MLLNRGVVLIVGSWLVAACTGESETEAGDQGAGVHVPAPAERTELPLRVAEKEAYFGDLHVHTSWSSDSWAMGNRVGPADAYRFARGEPVMLPTGIETQLPEPLDFVALTDHAEGFDVRGMCMRPGHPEYASEACESVRNPPQLSDSYFQAVLAQGGLRPRSRHKVLCKDLTVCQAAERDTWREVQAVANEFDDPGRFTTLIGYEFSSMLPQGGMLHRNVIFRGEAVTPYAVAATHVVDHADFFEQLDMGCQGDCEVLTIPHNTNYSWGVMFSRTDEDGSDFTDEELKRRAKIERLAEVTQMKGNSECLFGVGTTDEDCNFEPMFKPCQPGEEYRCASEASFVRNALLDGIDMADEGRTNPFKLGMIGSTDTHSSNPGDTDAQNMARFRPVKGNAEALKQIFRQDHPIAGPLRRFSEGGLAAVWAESNTRADIFDALQRREAFATSGSRMRIRFFGGNLPQDLAATGDVAAAYASGVPMGGDLDGGSVPRFWAWAVQDPRGATLDRIQIVKGWVAEGEQQHRVWDVACAGGRTPEADGRCPDTAASVDLATCTRRDDSGASELSAGFTDPDCQAGQHAFYYVRVLENPSCRWTTWFANSAGIEAPEDVSPTVQNRGWSSPIWIQPD
jgi:hypothetical protein